MIAASEIMRLNRKLKFIKSYETLRVEMKSYGKRKLAAG